MRSGRKLVQAALVAGAVVLAAPFARAQSSYVIDVTQVGNNVVETASGSIDLTGLNYQLTALYPNYGGFNAYFGYVGVGYSSAVDVYTGFSGPGAFSFETSGFANASSNTGVTVSVQGNGDDLNIPAGYMSNTVLGLSTSTFDNTTLAGLDLVDGSYVWSWSGGSITLNIEDAAVPEPASFAVLGVAIAAFGFMRRGRRIGARAAA